MSSIEKLKDKQIIGRKIVNIGGATRVSDIPATPEQQFFLLVRPRLPKGHEITYEPERFEITFDDGYSISTAPDWRIKKPCGTIISVEMTLAENLAQNGGKDPKEKQRWIMSHFPDRTYVVLYRKNCDSIEHHNPKVSFRHSKRIRKE